MRRFVVIACSLLLGLASLAHAQQRAKRLILKDGSYQLASKWEVQGDRVHFYSAERYDWEDLPANLVDWDATNKFNQENPRGTNPNASVADIKQADAEEAAERAKDEAARPLVAPGLRLPDTGGVFVLDEYREQPELVEIVQNGGELNKQTGKNIMRAVVNPIPTGSRETIELKGAHAKVQAHESSPTLFVDVNTSSSDTGAQASSAQLNRPDRFKIVRVQSKKDIRVVSNVKISLLGKVSNQEDIIPTTAQPINGGEWLKVVPDRPLQPGEYALVEMLDPKTINMFVWDFGVDASAPENATAWKPQPMGKETRPAAENPSLGQRPR